jgi:hypothetical protein
MRNKLELKLKYEVNLRSETKKMFGSRPENEKPENEKLNSRFTYLNKPNDLKKALSSTSALVQFRE